MRSLKTVTLRVRSIFLLFLSFINANFSMSNVVFTADKEQMERIKTELEKTGYLKESTAQSHEAFRYVLKNGSERAVVIGIG
jgi:hypothetical protein